MKIKHPGIARDWLISENFVLPVFKTWEPCKPECVAVIDFKRKTSLIWLTQLPTQKVTSSTICSCSFPTAASPCWAGSQRAHGRINEPFIKKQRLLFLFRVHSSLHYVSMRITWKKYFLAVDPGTVYQVGLHKTTYSLPIVQWNVSYSQEGEQ